VTACGTSSSDSGSTSGGASSKGGAGTGGTHAGGSGGASARGGSAGVNGGDSGASGDFGAAGEDAAGGATGSAGEGGAAGADGELGSAGEAGAENEAGAGGAPDQGCHDLTLLSGGTDVAAQGWHTLMQAPATLSYGADYVQLATSTTSGAGASGMLLLSYPNAIDVGKPFRIRVELAVEAVNPHNALDSGAALLASFTAPFGLTKDRQEMVYLDSNHLGWGDDSAPTPTTTTAPFSVADGTYHTYELSLDAGGTLSVSADGTLELSRTGFTTNGTFALGDQTNDANVDGTIRIRSVTKLCP